jgi:hypothetical protein
MNKLVLHTVKPWRWPILIIVPSEISCPNIFAACQRITDPGHQKIGKNREKIPRALYHHPIALSNALAQEIEVYEEFRLQGTKG